MQNFNMERFIELQMGRAHLLEARISVRGGSTEVGLLPAAYSDVEQAPGFGPATRTVEANRHASLNSGVDCGGFSKAGGLGYITRASPSSHTR